MLRLLSHHVNGEMMDTPWVAASDDTLAIYRMNERNYWGLRRQAAEAEVLFPFLTLHPVLAEWIRHIFEFLPHIVILTYCILAFVFLFQCTNADEMEQLYELQQARRELGRRLARSIYEYKDAAIPLL
jgi:hypothetical protein